MSQIYFNIKAGTPEHLFIGGAKGAEVHFEL